MVVAVALIVGGIAILVDRAAGARRRRSRGVADDPAAQAAIGIGFIQCLAMIPGVSRSGATIMGALALGVERRTAAEFSFFLAIPTMLGATVLRAGQAIAHELARRTVGFGLIAIGFVVAFVVALRGDQGGSSAIVTRHGFAPFAWYRIVAGSAALVWLHAR